MRFCFRGKLVKEEKDRALDKEIVATHWLSAGELQEKKPMHRSPLVQTCVDDYLAGRNYPLELFSKAFA